MLHWLLRKSIPSPNCTRLVLKPLPTLCHALRLRRRMRAVVISVVGMEGSPPPQRVAITEWDSMEKAEAFFKSKAWTDLGPDREKALKTIRRYAVEIVQ